MRFIIWYLFVFCLFQPDITVPIPSRNQSDPGGQAFYERIFGVSKEVRDSLAVDAILSGNVPDFYRHFVEIHTSIFDSAQQRQIKASYFVAPDYLSVGSDQDWVRIPLTPMAAQEIADSFQCFLPTKKMVDDIYRAAEVKIQPVPLLAFRDSTVTFWHHHLIIEGQRKGRKGLIAGIKKDIVLSGKVLRDQRPDRVAIYGWHKMDGNPIQPLYTGHVNSYVDYSHGIRLVYQKLKVEGRWMDYRDVMNHTQWRTLLCDDTYCDFYHY